MLLQAALGFSLALVDPLIKVFPGTAPQPVPYVAEAARGEVLTWQVVVHTDRPLEGIKVDVDGIKGLGKPRIRAIGYVPVDRSIPEAPKERIGTVPGLYPDPLLTDLPTSLKTGDTQAYWIDLPVSKNARPGTYSATFRFTGSGINGWQALSARVFSATVGRSRLWVTNWYANPPGDPFGHDPKFWKELEVYGKNMAEHRQNMAIVSPLSYAQLKPDGSFDFSVFNRFVETFKKAGVIGRIEGGHFGGRIGGVWSAQFEMTILELKDGKTAARNVDPAGPEADAFYAKFLPALVKDLKDHHWLDIYSQHLADEPIQANVGSYVAMRDLVRKYAPELKVMEATHTAKLAGSMDLWVPQFNYWADSYDFYRDRQAKGEEVWFYTCVYPQGEYANRFMELPLVETRLLHWLNFKYGATGYLHWGWNRWSMVGDPFKKTTYDQPGGSFLPAGDCFIVYPGKDGAVLDSIRWESMRDGIADYELLSMLKEKDPKHAEDLANRLVHGFTSYELDPAVFRSVRHELLEALSP
ncbi:MAG TPA: DUF4091 domain-containing protein [Fimbriimonadaceae bacterium]|nr:DUF4091 domain-containing protein [Fimbriimonadaceae bacterium]